MTRVSTRLPTLSLSHSRTSSLCMRTCMREPARVSLPCVCLLTVPLLPLLLLLLLLRIRSLEL